MGVIRAIEKMISSITDSSILKYSDKITNKLSDLDFKQLNKDSLSERSVKGYVDFMSNFLNDYTDLIEPYADLARKSTFPLSYPYFKWLKAFKGLNNVLFHEGVHFFIALQGGGKSTLAFDLISEILRTTGKSSYINANFEKPRYDSISKKHYVYFQFFELLEFFDMTVKDDDPSIKVSQKKKFNRHFDTIVLDEWLTEMNHRLNKTKDYNNIFMALITMIAHMRHQKMKRIYVLSQIDNTDTQLFSMFKYVHEIEIDLDVTYLDWIKTGMMTRHIKGWWIWTYGVKRNRKKQATEKTLIKKQYRHATADFTYFDTLSQAEKYAILAEDKINFIRE